MPGMQLILLQPPRTYSVYSQRGEVISNLRTLNEDRSSDTCRHCPPSPIYAIVQTQVRSTRNNLPTTTPELFNPQCLLSKQRPVSYMAHDEATGDIGDMSS